jgi:hypothetical protein
VPLSVRKTLVGSYHDRQEPQGATDCGHGSLTRSNTHSSQSCAGLMKWSTTPEAGEGLCTPEAV